MKAGIHPEYFKARAVCVCGNTFEVGGTKKEYQMDICYNCHPFYTGKHKLIDSEGRVERFRKKYAKK